MNKKRFFLVWLTNTIGFIVIDSILIWLTKDASEHFDFTGIAFLGILFGISITILRHYEIRKGWRKDDNNDE